MKLLRDFILVRSVRRLLAARRGTARRSYAVTVPAPRMPLAGNVVELRPRLRTEEPRHVASRSTRPVDRPRTQAAGS